MVQAAPLKHEWEMRPWNTVFKNGHVIPKTNFSWGTSQRIATLQNEVQCLSGGSCFLKMQERWSVCLLWCSSCSMTLISKGRFFWTELNNSLVTTEAAKISLIWLILWQNYNLFYFSAGPIFQILIFNVVTTNKAYTSFSETTFPECAYMKLIELSKRGKIASYVWMLRKNRNS